MKTEQEVHGDESMEALDSQEVPDVDQPKPSRKKKASPKKSRKRKPPKKKSEPEYNVEIHPETGAMQLQELYFLRLMNAEQKIRISERDLQIARSQVKDFQAHANNQLQILQNKVREISAILNSNRVEYLNEVKLVEEDTKLSLKDWTIDDDRILRPIEKKPPSDSTEE